MCGEDFENCTCRFTGKEFAVVHRNGNGYMIVSPDYYCLPLKPLPKDEAERLRDRLNNLLEGETK